MFATYGSSVIVTYMGTNMLTQEEVLGWLPPLVCAICGMLQISWLGPHPKIVCLQVAAVFS